MKTTEGKEISTVGELRSWLSPLTITVDIVFEDHTDDIIKTVTDRAGREWEMFYYESYFGMFCVKLAKDRNFDAVTSYHFTTRRDAEAFMVLLEVST